jgi:hypothetical protein
LDQRRRACLERIDQLIDIVRRVLRTGPHHVVKRCDQRAGAREIDSLTMDQAARLGGGNERALRIVAGAGRPDARASGAQAWRNRQE